MKTLFARLLAILAFVTLAVMNIQLVSARQTCPTINCGAGDLMEGGVSGACSSAQCWWANCLQRAGQCTSGNAQNCGYQLGCPNAPCTLNGSNCSGSGECCAGNVCNQDGVCGTGSPIMINLKSGSSNYHLTSYLDGVAFDLQGTGEMLQVGWTEANSQIGILALDRNGNGLIDSGAELFGTATRKKNGQLALHGFDALSDLDGGPGVSDGKINSSDSHYHDLRLWFDDNHDGVSQSHELVPLTTAGVSALFTAFSETRRIDRHGNLYKYEGEAFVLKNGKEFKHKLFDVFPIVAAPIQ